MQRLICVYCVASEGCECEGMKKQMILLATDSQTYAHQFKEEHEEDPYQCEICGLCDKYRVEVVSYTRKHFVYEDN